jgi:hypothetical protein
MAREFGVMDPKYLELLTKIKNTAPSGDYFESLAKAEEETFKDGKCPLCGGKLYRYAVSYFRDEIGYSFPRCEKCKKEFPLLFFDKEKIPTKGEKEFWEMMNTTYY